MIAGFLFGILFTLMLLVLAVFYRRKKVRQLLDKLPQGGENSRERVGETVVAVLNSGTRKRKRIRVTWYSKLRNLLRGIEK